MDKTNNSIKKDYNKKYYENLKESGKSQEKIKCNMCGKNYTYYGKSKHIKSQYHKLAENICNYNYSQKIVREDMIEN